ncbi:MAG: hypothetical protein ND866_21095 [Pyrinomonadaceae bacterium]|nr:hypothetical protein [Pyrinomonadaceae bacterium]
MSVAASLVLLLVAGKVRPSDCSSEGQEAPGSLAVQGSKELKIESGTELLVRVTQ